MPQNHKTGREGLENGYSRANQIGALIGAERLSNSSNEFRWNGRIVVIKTGSSAVVTRAMLNRVAAVVYGEKKDGDWILYKITSQKFEVLSDQAQSKNHAEKYRRVHRTQIRKYGQKIPID